jgi:predicted PurR-regulated permease PerM
MELGVVAVMTVIGIVLLILIQSISSRSRPTAAARGETDGADGSTAGTGHPGHRRVGVLAWVLWLARDRLSPFAVGAILAYLLLPIVRRLVSCCRAAGSPPSGDTGHPAGLHRDHCQIYLVVRLVIPPLIAQVGDILERAPTLAIQARQQTDVWLAQYHAAVPDELEATIESNISQIGASLGTAVRTALTSSASWLVRAAGLVIGFLVIPIWLFYVLKDQERGFAVFYSLFPPAVARDVQAIVGIIDSVLKRYIRGQLLLGLAIGIASYTFLFLIGIPYALALALVNGIFELVPIIGPWLGAIPAVIVVLALAPDKIVPVIIFYIVLQQVENVLLVPKIQGDAVDINPALLIIALVIGGNIGGVWGLLAAVPVAAIGRDVFLYLYRRLSPPEPIAQGSVTE